MSIKIKKFPYDRIKQSFVDSFDTSKLAKVSKGNKQTLLNPDGSVNRNKLDTLLKSKELKPFIADILTPPEVQWGVKKLDQDVRVLDKPKKAQPRKIVLWLDKVLTNIEKQLLQIPEFKNGTAEFLFFRVLKEPSSRQAFLTAMEKALDEGFETPGGIIDNAVSRFLETTPGLTKHDLFAREVLEQPDQVKKVSVAKPPTDNLKKNPLDSIPDDGFVAFLEHKRDTGDILPCCHSDSVKQYARYWGCFYGVKRSDPRINRPDRVDSWGRPLTRGPVTKKDNLPFFEYAFDVLFYLVAILFLIFDL